MLRLYAKQVPAEIPPEYKNLNLTDSERRGLERKRDTLIANDPDFTDVRVRWPWYKPNRPVSRKRVTLNCYEWELVWVE